ncbi:MULTISPECIES: hypothetical protein [unclassified Acinetobacter]|uniref:hypothetical protein n=1 Tax=unclassified Acinetobacter TaxID=196816 RepID=UPI0015D22080|nr:MULTISPECIES: hypothetical protein [unclassified Acinetobacter]
MFKVLMLVVAFVSTSINNLSYAETNTLNANKVLEPFIFEIGSNFSDIQSKFSLEVRNSGVNFIKESKWYKLNTPVGFIFLQEWQGKLHCIAYEIDTDNIEIKKELINYLFEKYKNNFEWIGRVDNGFYISYESSNDSIQGIYAYSLGTTISFTSNEIRKAETKIRFLNL